MTIELARLRIDINKEPGVYIFYDHSATGKTYIGTESINQYSDIKSMFITYSADKSFILELPKKIIDSEADVIWVDRYDMFENEDIDKALYAAAKAGAIVLVDLKHI